MHTTISGSPPTVFLQLCAPRSLPATHLIGMPCDSLTVQAILFFKAPNCRPPRQFCASCLHHLPFPSEADTYTRNAL